MSLSPLLLHHRYLIRFFPESSEERLSPATSPTRSPLQNVFVVALTELGVQLEWETELLKEGAIHWHLQSEFSTQAQTKAHYLIIEDLGKSEANVAMKDRLLQEHYRQVLREAPLQMQPSIDGQLQVLNDILTEIRVGNQLTERLLNHLVNRF